MQQKCYHQQIPPPITEKREHSPLPLPEIHFSGKVGDGFRYQSAYDTEAKRIVERPENGTLIYSEQSTQGKESTVLRKVVHELAHQQFDHLSSEERNALIDAFLKKYDIKKIREFLFDQDPSYETACTRLQQERGERAVTVFVMNEFIAHASAYVEIPVAQKQLQEHYTQDVWESILAEAIKQGKTEKDVLEELQAHPEFLPPPDVSPAYDTMEKTYFTLRDVGLLLQTEDQQLLQKHGIGNNGKRAQEVLRHIKMQQEQRSTAPQ